MKKICSLVKATMTSDMSLFKINRKSYSKRKNTLLIFIFSFFFMIMIWSYANTLFEKFAPLNLQYVVLSIFVFLAAIFTVIQGIYKSGPLIFNCRDDQLLFSLPIRKSTILFIRIFKFYLFELMFDALLIVPLVIAYIRWANTLSISFFISSFVMLIMLPIIPIIISCIIGTISSFLTSLFKYKNVAQTIITTLFLLMIFVISFNIDNFLNYLVKNVSSINDIITKVYYPAGVYANLVTNFNIKDLLIFVLVNIVLFAITIFILSKIYFKINTRLKNVITTKSHNNKKTIIKSNSVRWSLIKKELNTFFNTPVFIINAGFGLFLFLIACGVIIIKFDSFIPVITGKNGLNISKELINSNISLLVYILISSTAFMTSITNSVISLEGKNINILKSLPVSTKTILLSKIYSGLVLTTPVFIVGDIFLFIKFKLNILEMILLLMISVLVPLISHFIGLIVNLKFPKLDAENSTEVVKQSTSSFISVIIGMILLLINVFVITRILGSVSSLIVLIALTIIYMIMDVILYLYLIKRSTIDFNKLTV